MMAYRGNSNGGIRDSEPSGEVGVPPTGQKPRCVRSPGPTRPGNGVAVKPSMCLCMIVRNEAKVIERCLASARDLVDTWVISDTGSTDGTQQLIRTAMHGIPGELHEEPWVNFGHNRTLNIRHARGKADYLLLLDADHVIRRDGPLPRLTADAYMLRHEGATEYRIRRLVSGSVAWRYEGVTHEYLTVDTRHRQANLDALVIEDFYDGGSRRDKFERDARLLSAEMERDPANTRTVFYLAQTMRDMGSTEEPWVGDHAGSLQACDRLLAMPDLPDVYRKQTVTNREFAATRMTTIPEPTTAARVAGAPRTGPKN